MLLPTSPKSAKYMAGYALEFVLKARYCTLRGWSSFPSGTGELKEWNRRDGVVMQDNLFVHDLDALLRLSDSVHLTRSSFNHIDWKRACDWSEQLRYTAPDSVTPAEAEAHLGEVEKAVAELHQYEVVMALWRIERDLTERYGLFHCFAYLKDLRTGRWELVTSTRSRTEAESDARWSALVRAYEQELDPDFRAQVRNFHDIPPSYYPVRPILIMSQISPTFRVLHGRITIIQCRVAGFPPIPDGYLITAGDWSEDELQRASAAATDIH